MAGSRRENFGSIFTRMTGLMRAGALEVKDRPIWYDILKALPPKPVPPPKEIRSILYPEDFIRVHFHKTFVETGVAVLTNAKIKSVSQRFVEKYLELQKQNLVPAEQLFDEATRILREEGVKLITHQEKEALNMAKAESRPKERVQQPVEDDFDYNTSTIRPFRGSKTYQDTEKSPKPQVDIDDVFSDKR